MHFRITYIHEYLSWNKKEEGYYGYSWRAGMKLHRFIGIRSLPFLKNKANGSLGGFGWCHNLGMVGLRLVISQNPCVVFYGHFLV
jgi:hypothetical protein